MSERFPGGFIMANPTAPTVFAAPGIWTLDQAQQYIKAGTWPGSPDPYFPYTTLLLPGNGTNGAQNNTFLDSSTNNFTITRNGNTTQGTFTPYGANWSNYFNGPSSGTYFETPTNTAFQLGTSDFTIEFWTFITSGASDTCVCRTDTGGSAQNGMLLGYSDGTNILWYATSNGTTWNLISGAILCSVASVKNTWAHFAYVRSGSTFTAYVNGTQVYTTTSSASINQVTNGFRIGTANTGTGATNFGGYISNFRYVKGSAVYPANFTPPTAPLTAITNTSLLTCQSNRFIDNSANNFALTVSGSPTVQVFSPFNPTASYAAATIGGSGYFDGTGDYLTIADNIALDMVSSDFTIEGWIFPAVSSGGSAGIFSKRASGAVSDGVLLYYNLSGLTPSLLIGSGGSWVINQASSIAFTLGQWNHFAVVRNGTSFVLYINGVSGVSATSSSSVTDNSAAFAIGAWAADGTGIISASYFSNFRVVKGTAVYTAAFTPPTSPLTAISNTSLLLNFTNAGVIDNAMMNDMETVGNAQISTAQSKWGGASLAFDGTGDYLICQTASTANFAMGTGDWTVECWVYLNATSGSRAIFDTLPLSSGSTTALRIQITNGVVQLLQYSTVVTSGGSLSTNTWYHIAVCKASGTTRIFVDGTQVNTNYTDTGNYICGSNRPIIGVEGFSLDYALNGYIDDMRITKGYARYTANFTVPNGPFPTR